MLPLLLAGIAISSLLYAIFSEDGEPSFKVSSKSNCSNEFIRFNDNLSITPSKQKQLATARRVLQKKIKEYFGSKSNTTTPSFYIQGSIKHETAIRKSDDTCDVDVGVYFQNKPSITSFAIHSNIAKALGNHTNEKVTIKSKCVRIYYSNLFHIDLPVYYKDLKSNQYYIGTGNNVWEPSDPKLFSEWLKEKLSSNEQKVRLVKYFKAWSDNVKIRKGIKMPSGLAFTIWVVKHYSKDKREDMAFVKTAYQIFKQLKETSKDQWDCKMPVQPYDDVIKKLSMEQRENFLKALAELINSSVKIFASDSKDDCIHAWKYLLGKWFPS